MDDIEDHDYGDLEEPEPEPEPEPDYEDDESEDTDIEDDTIDEPVQEKPLKHEYKKKIIPNDQRKTSNILQKSEVANILAMRAIQISKYYTNFAPSINEMRGTQNRALTPIDIAKKELYTKNCPFYLNRIVHTIGRIQYIERWDVREMIIPHIDDF